MKPHKDDALLEWPGTLYQQESLPEKKADAKESRK